MTTKCPLTLRLEPAGDSKLIAGWLCDESGEEHRFAGWLELLTLLEDPADGPPMSPSTARVRRGRDVVKNATSKETPMRHITSMRKNPLWLRKKSMFAAAVCAAAVASASAGAAFAGEVTGNGKPTAGPAHANSICVFSGKNDDPNAPLSLDLNIAPNGPGGVSQSYGQDVKLGLDPHVFNPGDACRGGSNPDRP